MNNQNKDIDLIDSIDWEALFRTYGSMSEGLFAPNNYPELPELPDYQEGQQQGHFAPNNYPELPELPDYQEGQQQGQDGISEIKRLEVPDPSKVFRINKA